MSSEFERVRRITAEVTGVGEQDAVSRVVTVGDAAEILVEVEHRAI